MKLGRPKTPKADKKGNLLGVRLKTGERQIIANAALKSGKKLSDWVREVLLTAANHVAE